MELAAFCFDERASSTNVGRPDTPRNWIPLKEQAQMASFIKRLLGRFTKQQPRCVEAAYIEVVSCGWNLWKPGT